MLKTQLKFIVTIVLVLGLSISFQSLLASWQAPTASPPSQPNIFKPINEGNIYQSKSGHFVVNNDFGVTGDMTIMDGFNSSDANLFIDDDHQAWIRLQTNSNSAASYLSLYYNNNKLWSVGQNPTWGLGGHDFYIYRDGSETASGVKGLVIDNSTGNVGVGPKNPTKKLDVDGKIRMRDETISTDGNDIVATKGYVDANVLAVSGTTDSDFFAPSVYIVTGPEVHSYNSWSTAWCNPGDKVIGGYWKWSGSTCDPPCGCGRNSKIDWTPLGQHPSQSGTTQGWTSGTYGHCNRAVAYCLP